MDEPDDDEEPWAIPEGPGHWIPDADGMGATFVGEGEDEGEVVQSLRAGRKTG